MHHACQPWLRSASLRMDWGISTEGAAPVAPVPRGLWHMAHHAQAVVAHGGGSLGRRIA
jgi:hypothetical protein